MKRKNFIQMGAWATAGWVMGVPKIALAIQPTPYPALDLVKKGDPRYDLLRKGYNKRIDKYPAAIALCKSTEEVAEAVKYAAANKLPVAIKSGGHSMEGFSCNEGGLVVNLSQLNGITFLEGDKIKVGPGCIQSKLYANILPKGRIIPAGSCGTVGIGGVTMGGGYGMFSRKYGMACDSLVEAKMVDGQGNIVSTKDNPELLWALRGGGAGNFGVVTELVFQTYKAPATMQSHHFKSRNLTAAKAKELLKRWFEMTAKLPETCFGAFVQNGKTAIILVTNYGKHTPELQANLTAFGKFTETFRSAKPAALAPKLKQYYGQLLPLNFKNSSAGFYSKFKDIEGCIESVLDKVTKNPGMIYQINTMGGKVKDKELAKASCFPHRDFDYISELQAYWEKPTQEERLRKTSSDILQILEKHGIKTQYFNYCSLEFKDWKAAYYGSNYAKLVEIKKKYDPNDVIRHPQSIELK